MILFLFELTCSQIWLNPLVNDHQCGYSTKLAKENLKKKPWLKCDESFPQKNFLNLGVIKKEFVKKYSFSIVEVIIWQNFVSKKLNHFLI
jgi:hypothetical protein